MKDKILTILQFFLVFFGIFSFHYLSMANDNSSALIQILLINDFGFALSTVFVITIGYWLQNMKDEQNDLNINKMLIYSVLLLLFYFIFYWFIYRPIKIRSSCNFKIQSLSVETNELIYKYCLRENGLEK